MRLSFRKPEWLDSAVGIAALVLSVLPTLALLADPAFPSKLAVYGALTFGLLIILISALFRPRHSLAFVDPDRIERMFSELQRSSTELIVVNIQKLPAALHRSITDELSTRRCTLIGDAAQVHLLLKETSNDLHEHIFARTLIHPLILSDAALYFLRATRTLSALLFADKEIILLRLTDPALVAVVAKLLRKEHDAEKSFLSMSSITDALEFLTTVSDLQKRYERTFHLLQRGELELYSSEVQIAQSKWVESRRFSTIDATDVTTNPQLLSTRTRYWSANKAFIANGGKIRRIFIIESQRQQDAQFMAALKAIMLEQASIGIEIGGQVVEQIPHDMRKDYIIYGSSLVLVEDAQANSDYSLGRSTAHFTGSAVLQYREMFDALWTGVASGTPATDVSAYWLTG